jgi:sigma-B regulation protein RsbU (phosphoserine phosphatase)
MRDLTEEMQEHGYFLLRCLLLTLAVTLLASVITALVMRRYVLNPVRSLAQATREFIPEENGTYSLERISQAEIRSNDEIGDLSRDIRTMQENIVTNTENLARMTAERERTATELELAARIQADALPNVFPAFPEHGEFSIFASMTPAKEVGGDFYDFFLIDETHLGIVMADVSDKGVPAALFMMSAKSLIRTYAKTETSPAQVMQAVNDRLCENNRHHMFVTVWFGILDLSTGRITAVNAGHEYPALMPSGGCFDLFRGRSGFVVGGMAGMRYRELEIDLMSGAKIFLYTDGVPEAHNAAGEMFGMERMIASLNTDPKADPQILLKNMRKAVDEFVKDAEQFDDLTMLCVEYKGKSREDKRTEDYEHKKDRANTNQDTVFIKPEQGHSDKPQSP